MIESEMINEELTRLSKDFLNFLTPHMRKCIESRLQGDSFGQSDTCGSMINYIRYSVYPRYVKNKQMISYLDKITVCDEYKLAFRMRMCGNNIDQICKELGMQEDKVRNINWYTRHAIEKKMLEDNVVPVQERERLIEKVTRIAAVKKRTAATYRARHKTELHEKQKLRPERISRKNLQGQIEQLRAENIELKERLYGNMAGGDDPQFDELPGTNPQYAVAAIS